MQWDESHLSREQLLTLIKLQTDIAKLGHDLSAVLELVTQRSMQLTHCDGAVIEFAEDDVMVYRAACGIAAAQLGLRIPQKTSLSGLSVATSQILRCDDAFTDPRVDRVACERVGLRSMLVIPLQHGDQTVGVLKVLSGQPSSFDDDDVALLAMLSELIAASMFFAARYDYEDLFYRATHDQMTGLANRALFLDHMRTALAQAQRKKTLAGIFMIDMNGLKKINDTMGHRSGDAAICEFARRLKQNSREADTVARFGGDEFGMLLSTVDAAANLSTKLQRLKTEIELPFEFEGQSLPLSGSFGSALFPHDSDDIEILIDIADQEMYSQKRAIKQSR